MLGLFVSLSRGQRWFIWEWVRGIYFFLTFPCGECQPKHYQFISFQPPSTPSLSYYIWRSSSTYPYQFNIKLNSILDISIIILYLIMKIIYIFFLLYYVTPGCLYNFGNINQALEYQTSTQTDCKVCPYGCLSCDFDKKCQSCISSYYKDSNICKRCQIDNCQRCTSTKCSKCLLGSYISGNECLLCPQNVAQCSSSSNINSCLQGKQKQLGFYFIQGVCIKCQDQNCLKCTRSQCTLCKQQYSTDNNNIQKCSKCSVDNCGKCQNSNSNCQKCVQGYRLQNNSCIECTTTNCAICNKTTCQLCKYNYYIKDKNCLLGGSILCKYSYGQTYSYCQSNNTSQHVQDFCNSYSYTLTNTPTYCLANIFTRTSVNYFYPAQGQQCTLPNTWTKKIDALGQQPLYLLTLTHQVIIVDASEVTVKYTLGNLNLSKTLNGLSNQNICGSSTNDIRAKNTIQLSLIDIPTSMLFDQSSKPNLAIEVQGSGQIRIGQVYVSLKRCFVENCVICYSQISCRICKKDLYLQLNRCLKQCDTGYYTLQQDGKKNCQTTCPQGFYKDDANFKCQKCTNNCSKCKSDTQCTACSQINGTKYYLKQDKCVQKCQQSQFDENVFDKSIYKNQQRYQCRTCQPPCKLCQQTNGRNCIECLAGYVNTSKCLIICPSGFFVQLKAQILQCSKCQQPCQQCISTSTTCTKCKQNKTLEQTKCVDNCSKNKFSQNNVCKECLKPCQGCNNRKNCSSCSLGYLNLQTTQNTQDGSYNCQNLCQDNQYQNDNKCTKCSQNCLTCKSQKICSSCNQGYLNYSKGCNKSCPNEYYKDDQSKQCKKCVSPCKLCTSQVVCESCFIGLLLQNKCLFSCPNGYYQKDDKCELCANNCMECQNQTKCLSCNGTQNFYLKNGSCYKSCSAGQYKFVDKSQQNKGYCKKCIDTCRTCQNTDYNCTKCIDTYFLYKLNDRGSCFLQCPQGTFKINTDSLCTKCDSLCKTCSTQGCLSCPPFTYLQNKLCVENCSNKSKYPNDENGQCTICSGDCQQCLSQASCTKCKDENKFLYFRSCIDQCPQGLQQAQKDSIKICSKCQINNCQKCNNQSSCQKCQNQYYKNGKQCKKNCQQNQYKSINVFKGNTCQICKSPCNKCTSQSKCQDCAKGFFHRNQSNQCLSQCYQGQFKNQKNCQKCQLPCQTCTGNNSNCLTCSGQTFLQRNQGKCLNSCSLGQYGSEIEKKCLPCQKPCNKCEFNQRNCQQCGDLSFLYINTCINSCPDSFYGDNQIHSCIKCSQECKTCTSSDCTSCHAQMFFDRQTNKCLKQCPLNKYTAKDNFNNNLCQNCPEKCETCRDSQSCLTCEASKIFQSGDCVTQCKQGFVNLNNLCEPCPQGCQLCNITEGIIKCSKCVIGFLHQGQCLVDCPSKFWQNYGQTQCSACIQPCSECINELFCQSCIDNYYLYKKSQDPLIQYCIPPPCPQSTWFNWQIKACVKECPKQYFFYIQQKICYKECPVQLLKFESKKKQCVLNCPQNYYLNKQNTCQECPQGAFCSQLPQFKTISYYRLGQLIVQVIFNTPITYVQQVNNQTFKISMTQLPDNTPIRLLQFESYKVQQTNQRFIILAINTSTPFLNNKIQIQLTQRSIKGKTGQNLQNLKSVSTIINYDYYDQNNLDLGWDVFRILGLVFSIIILILTLIALILNSFKSMYWIFEYGQILYLLIYLQIEYPPVVNSFFYGFRQMHFYFMNPTLKLQAVFSQCGPTFYSYNIDCTFLRNVIMDIILISIFILLCTIAYIMAWFSTKTIQKVQVQIDNSPDQLKKKDSQKDTEEKKQKVQVEIKKEGKVAQFSFWFRQRMIWSTLFDFVWIVYFNLGLFAFAQYRSINSSDSFLVFNYILSIITSILIIMVIPFSVYLINKYSKSSQNQVVKIKALVWGLNIKKNVVGLMRTPFLYLRKIIIIFSIGLYTDRPIYCLFISIIATFLSICSIFFFTPYKIQKYNWLNIAIQIITCLLFIELMFLSMVNITFLEGEKESLGYVIFITAIINLIIGIVWAIYQLYLVIYNKVKGKPSHLDSTLMQLDSKSVINTNQLEKSNEIENNNVKSKISKINANNSNINKITKSKIQEVNPQFIVHEQDQSDINEQLDKQRIDAPQYLIKCVNQLEQDDQKYQQVFA